jgi:hypothetical protein
MDGYVVGCVTETSIGIAENYLDASPEQCAYQLGDQLNLLTPDQLSEFTYRTVIRRAKWRIRVKMPFVGSSFLAWAG